MKDLKNPIQRPKGSHIKLNVDGLEVSKAMIDAAQYLVLTGSAKATAEIIGYTPETISSWLANNEDFRQLVNQFTEGMLCELRAELVGVSREALEVVRKIMNDENIDPAQRLKAAQDILSRAGLNAEQKQRLDINNNYNIFSQLPDDELDKIINIDFEECEKKEVVDVECSKREDSASEDGEIKEDGVE